MKNIKLILLLVFVTHNLHCKDKEISPLRISESVNSIEIFLPTVLIIDPVGIKEQINIIKSNPGMVIKTTDLQRITDFLTPIHLNKKDKCRKDILRIDAVIVILWNDGTSHEYTLNNNILYNSRNSHCYLATKWIIKISNI